MAAKIEIVNPPAGYKSDVWKTFGFKKDDKKVVVCKLCLTELKYSGNTTNMSVHLRRHHKHDHTSSCSPAAPAHSVTIQKGTSSTENTQMQIINCFGGLSVQHKNLITRRIAEFIIQDLRPYSVVSSKAFMNMMKVMQPKYTIPSRQHFSEIIVPSLYEETKQKVIESLNSTTSVALTTDSWTSRCTQSYITITAQFIDSDWVMRNFVLQTRLMEENHTGVNIANVLLDAVQEWGLAGKHPALVSDNASNMVVAARESHLEPFVRCFAHTLNLAAQKGLKVLVVNKLLSKVRRIITFFHKSSVAAAIFTKKRKLLGLPDHKLKMDVSTRWNSAYEMLERFLEQQPAVYAALMDTKDLRKREMDLCVLNETDISNAEAVVTTMRQFKTATTVLCTESGPTLSLICPLLSRLQESLMISPEDTNVVKSLKTAMRENLQHRYENDMALLRIASALDPRFKELHFLESDEKDHVWTEVNKLVCEVAALQLNCPQVKQEKDIPTLPVLPALPTLPDLGQGLPVLSVLKAEPTPAEPQSPPSKKSALDELLGDAYIVKVELPTPKSPDHIARCELAVYHQEIPIPLHGNPLLWWKEREAKLPCLASLAKRNLGVPATSVPSERVFSTTGDILSAQRSSLKPQHVDMLVFLKKNM